MAIDGGKGFPKSGFTGSQAGQGPESATGAPQGKTPGKNNLPGQSPKGRPGKPLGMGIHKPWQNLMGGQTQEGQQGKGKKEEFLAKKKSEAKLPNGLGKEGPSVKGGPLMAKEGETQENQNNAFLGSPASEQTENIQTQGKPHFSVWIEQKVERFIEAFGLGGIATRLRQEGVLGFFALVWYDPQKKKPGSLGLSLATNGILLVVIIFLVLKIFN
jgi:hypothetical protein